MKNRKTALLLCAAMTIGILSGYSETVQAEEPAEISIWHDGDEAIMQVIQEQVNEELSGDSITVNFEKKSGLTDQLKLYGNDAANGPDMYLYAHDSLGTFAEMGMLSPITEVVSEDVYQDMLPMTLEAGQYKGEQYLSLIHI